VPKIRRWFNVSHDINSDPEVWELTDRFGDRGLRAWLECLSIADRNDGLIPGDRDRLVRALSIKLNTNQTRVSCLLDWFEERTWLTQDPFLRVRNYLTYKPVREVKKEQHASPPNPPNLPSETDFKKNHKNDSPTSSKKLSSVPTPWPDDSLWLKDFLETQRYVTPPAGTLMNPDWWNSVSETCGGLVREWLETEFARMSAWIAENPRRSPASPVGWKRFVRHWLEKAHDIERRKAYAQPKRGPNFQRH
jgi:hypothetical protein